MKLKVLLSRLDLSDNIMVVIYFMKRKTHEKTGWMGLKLDRSKAYDRVKWVFIWEMLSEMDFGGDSVGLIMQCRSWAKYQTCHARRRFGSFIPCRGIPAFFPSVVNFVWKGNLFCLKNMKGVSYWSERWLKRDIVYFYKRLHYLHWTSHWSA